MGNGSYYFRARWYDPITGRWLSKDPIGISGGLNQYAAFNCNPVMFVDPDGLDYRFIVEGPIPRFGHTIVEIRTSDGRTRAYDVQGWDPDLNAAEQFINTLFLRRTQGTVERRSGPFDRIYHHPGDWQETCGEDDQKLIDVFEKLARTGIGGVGYNFIYANSMNIPRAIVENTLNPPDRSGELIFEFGSSPFSE